MRFPLRIGLVGCGRVAERYYLPALSRIESATLVAVAEPAAGRHAIVAGRDPKCSIYRSSDELVQDEAVDAVIITSSPATHPGIVACAVQANKPVLVEKPLAVKMEEQVRELAQQVTNTRACVQMGFNRRFWQPIQHLRDCVAKLHGAHPAEAQLSMSSDVNAWDPVSPSPDALIDLGSHQLDLLRFVFRSELLSVRATWNESGVMRMQVRLANGTTADCRVAHGEPSHEWIAVQCDGRRYRAHASSDLLRPDRGARRFALDAAGGVVRRVRGRPISLIASFERQLVDFVDCVQASRAPSPNIHDGVSVVEALDAVRTSAEQGGEEIVLAA